MKCIDNSSIWRRGFELAEEVQKMIDDLPAWESENSLGSLRKTTLSVPDYVADGLIMGNIRDTKRFLWALNSLEELRKGLKLTEQRWLLCRGSHPQD